MRDLDCWPSPADLAASSDVREEFYRRTGGPLPRAERGDVAATIFPPLASDGVRDCNAPTVYTRGRDSSCTGPVPTGDADGPYSLPPSPHAPVRPSVAAEPATSGAPSPRPVCDMGTSTAAMERVLRDVCAGYGGTCWIWTGALDRYGYGRLRWSGAWIGAHRLAWFGSGRTMPCDGLVIDHLCRVRSCVNPDHLRVATNRTNVLSGEGLAARFARRNKCMRGHPFSGENLRMVPNRHGRPTRRCRACYRDLEAARRARRSS